MSVARILNGKGSTVFTLQPEKTLMDAVIALREYKVGAMVISDDGSAIEGILSERDIVRAIAAKGQGALGEPVSGYMTKNVITCSENTLVPELMDIMTKGRFRHLPVAKDGKLVGLISIGDVVKRRIAEVEAEAEDIKSYIASA